MTGNIRGWGMARIKGNWEIYIWAVLVSFRLAPVYAKGLSEKVHLWWKKVVALHMCLRASFRHHAQVSLHNRKSLDGGGRVLLEDRRGIIETRHKRGKTGKDFEGQDKAFSSLAHKECQQHLLPNHFLSWPACLQHGTYNLGKEWLMKENVWNWEAKQSFYNETKNIGGGKNETAESVYLASGKQKHTIWPHHRLVFH